MEELVEKAPNGYLETKRMSLKKKRHPKLKKKEALDDREFSSDENFAFIVGFTSGGAPYGITHEEMAEMEKVNDKIDNNDQ